MPTSEEMEAMGGAWAKRDVPPDIPGSPWQVSAALHDEFVAGWDARAAYDAARSGEAEDKLRETLLGPEAVLRAASYLQLRLPPPPPGASRLTVAKQVSLGVLRSALAVLEPRQDQPVDRASGEREGVTQDEVDAAMRIVKGDYPDDFRAVCGLCTWRGPTRATPEAATADSFEHGCFAYRPVKHPKTGEREAGEYVVDTPLGPAGYPDNKAALLKGMEREELEQQLDIAWAANQALCAARRKERDRRPPQPLQDGGPESLRAWRTEPFENPLLEALRQITEPALVDVNGEYTKTEAMSGYDARQIAWNAILNARSNWQEVGALAESPPLQDGADQHGPDHPTHKHPRQLGDGPMCECFREGWDKCAALENGRAARSAQYLRENPDPPLQDGGERGHIDGIEDSKAKCVAESDEIMVDDLWRRVHGIRHDQGVRHGFDLGDRWAWFEAEQPVWIRVRHPHQDVDLSHVLAFCIECGEEGKRQRVEHRFGAWLCPTHRDRCHVRFERPGAHQDVEARADKMRAKASIGVLRETQADRDQKREQLDRQQQQRAETAEAEVERLREALRQISEEPEFQEPEGGSRRKRVAARLSKCREVARAALAPSPDDRGGRG